MVTGPPESLRTWVGCTAVPRPPIHFAKGPIDRLFKTTSVSFTQSSFPCRIVFRSHSWAKNVSFFLLSKHYLSWISLGTNLTWIGHFSNDFLAFLGPSTSKHSKSGLLSATEAFKCVSQALTSDSISRALSFLTWQSSHYLCEQSLHTAGVWGTQWLWWSMFE